MGGGNAATAHGLHGQRRNVDGRDAETGGLERQTVATGAGADIKYASAAMAQGRALERGHGRLGAEEGGDREFVVVELWGEHQEAVGRAAFVEIGNRPP